MKFKIFKRIASLSVTAAMAIGMMASQAAPIFADDAPAAVPGLYVADYATSQYVGFNLILGSDDSQWPYSTGVSGDSTEPVAFTPVKDATYHLAFNVTSTGASGFRVRWLKDNTNGSYTAGDTAVVNDHSFTADQTADFVPAYFSGTIAAGETKDYYVDFTMDGSEEADGLIGNVCLRGAQGSSDFTINTVTVTDASGNMLVNYDASAVAAPATSDENVPAPSYAENATAIPTPQGVSLNGAPIAIAGYNINGFNYFKLRDVAAVLNATNAKFDVGYANGTINLVSGTAYTVLSTDLAASDGKSKDATLSTDAIFVNGSAATITAYKIDGSNYFQLRDLGTALGFGVDFVNGVITITAEPITTTSSADIDLGAMNFVNNDTQQGWQTDSLDSASTVTAAELTSAKYLVLEFAQAPTGGMQIIWQGDGSSGGLADWNQTDKVIPNDGMSDTSIVIDLASTLKNYDEFQASTQIKLIIAYYSNNIADLGITRAYLTDTAPTA